MESPAPLPLVDPTGLSIHQELIPAQLCLKWQLLPLADDPPRMLVGLVRPLTYFEIDDLRLIVGAEFYFVQLAPGGGPLPPWEELAPHHQHSLPEFEPHPQAYEAFRQHWQTCIEAEAEEPAASEVNAELLTDFGYLYRRLSEDKLAAPLLYQEMTQRAQTDTSPLLAHYLEFWRGRHFLFTGEHPEQILLTLADHCAQQHPVSQAARAWLKQQPAPGPPWLKRLLPPAQPQHYPFRISLKAGESARQPSLTPDGRCLLTLGESISVIQPARRSLSLGSGPSALVGQEAVAELRPGQLIVYPLMEEQDPITFSHPDLGGDRLAITPDLRLLVTARSGDSYSQTEPAEIHIWNLQEEGRLTKVGHLGVVGRVEELSLSSDGLRLLAIHGKYELSRWQLDLKGRSGPRARGFTPWGSQWPEGYQVDQRGHVVNSRYDLGPSDQIQEFASHPPWTLVGLHDNVRLFGSDEKVVAHWQTGSTRKVHVGTLEITWNPYGTGFQVRHASGARHDQASSWSVLDCAISSDGRRALSVDGDGHSRLWDLTRSVTGLGIVGPSGAWSGALDSTGQRALFSDRNSLALWDLEEACCLRRLEPIPEGISHLTFVHDQQVAVLAAEWVFVYELDRPEPPTRIARDAPGFVRGVCAERMLAYYEAPTRHRWGPARVRDLLGGRRMSLPQPPAKPFSFHKFAGAEHQPLLATCNQESTMHYGDTLRVWDLSGENPVLRNRWRLEFCSGFDVDNQGQVVVSADGLQLYPGQPIPDAPLCVHDSVVIDLVLSQDGRRLASGSCDQTVAVFDLQTGCCTGRYSGHGFWASPDLSADGRWLLVTSDGGSWLHDLDSGQHRQGIFALSRCGLVVSREEGGLAVFQPDNGQRIHIYREHSHPVTKFQVSPYGNGLVASGDGGGQVRVWNLHNGHTQVVLQEEPQGAIQEMWWRAPDSVVFSSNRSHTTWCLKENRSGPLVWEREPVDWLGSSEAISPGGDWRAILQPNRPSQLVVEHLASGHLRHWPTPRNSRVLLFRGPDQLLVGLGSGEILFFQL